MPLLSEYPRGSATYQRLEEERLYAEMMYQQQAAQQQAIIQQQSWQGQQLGGGFAQQIQSIEAPRPAKPAPKPRAYKDGIRGELQSEVDEWLKDVA